MNQQIIFSLNLNLGISVKMVQEQMVTLNNFLYQENTQKSNRKSEKYAFLEVQN